jgi:hypothetical protein
MMKNSLRVGEILHILQEKPVLISGGTANQQFIARPDDRDRQVFFKSLITKIEKAEKYIFDSGQDTDLELVMSVRETATAMMEMGLFQMPFQSIWIEDPFTEIPNDRSCNFYLVEQQDDIIRLIFIQRFDEQHIPNIPRGMRIPLMIHIHALEIEINKATDQFLVCDVETVDPAHGKAYAEAIYSLKKFVVMLNTRGTVTERVGRQVERTGGDHRRRTYPYSIINHPQDRTTPTGLPRGKINYCKLVAGYNWGKNTRPPTEWRYVAAYWRGLNNPVTETKTRVIK